MKNITALREKVSTDKSNRTDERTNKTDRGPNPVIIDCDDLEMDSGSGLIPAPLASFASQHQGLKINVANLSVKGISEEAISRQEKEGAAGKTKRSKETKKPVIQMMELNKSPSPEHEKS